MTVQAVTQAGLLGRYYNNLTMSGVPDLQRSEMVNFTWRAGSPGAGVNADNFSVRWSGQIIPTRSGNYTFRTQSDDGVRLYVNGVLRINNWTDHTLTTNTSASINLTAGTKYNIVMEFYEKGGDATARLQWRVPGTTSYVVIPSAQLSNNGN
ncbi:MAG: hypothetical protein FJ190_11270 [Gammaproteobacteria bacterium]|nr:hypothetical protein [Gammaproteobacteria bacterium]